MIIEKDVLYYFYWSKKDPPSWGNWVFPWRQSSYRLSIISSSKPFPPFDTFNPNIQWVDSLEKEESETAIPLPSLWLFPSLEQKKSTCGSLISLEKDWIFTCQNPPPYEEIWKLFSEKNPSDMPKEEARFALKICQLLGEWTKFAEILPFCRFTNNHQIEFHRALLHWAKTRSYQDRDCQFRDKLLTHCSNTPETFLWLLRLHSHHPKWDPSYIYFQILSEEKNVNGGEGWIENPDQEILQLCLELGKSEPKLFSSIWKMVIQSSNICSSLMEKIVEDYSKKATSLTQLKNVEMGDLWSNGIWDGDFVPSSAGLVVYPSNPNFYLVNVRAVNYRIQSDGSYKSYLGGKECNPYNGITKNYMYIMDRKTLKPVTKQLFCMKNDSIPDRNQKEKAIVGVEDIRLIDRFGETWFYGVTKEFSPEKNIRILYGRYNTQTFQLDKTLVLKPPIDTPCEKNWTWLSPDIFIYKWHPLEIGQIDGNQWVKTHSIETPIIFQDFRGSTPVLSWKGLLWTLTHKVIYDERGLRVYLHFMVVLHRENYSVVGISEPILFEKLQIEYCIGMDILNGQFLFLYSTMDSSSRYVRLSVEQILEKIVWVVPSIFLTI